MIWGQLDMGPGQDRKGLLIKISILNYHGFVDKGKILNSIQFTNLHISLLYSYPQNYIQDFVPWEHPVVSSSITLTESATWHPEIMRTPLFRFFFGKAPGSTTLRVSEEVGISDNGRLVLELGRIVRLNMI